MFAARASNFSALNRCVYERIPDAPHLHWENSQDMPPHRSPAAPNVPPAAKRPPSHAKRSPPPRKDIMPGEGGPGRSHPPHQAGGACHRATRCRTRDHITSPCHVLWSHAISGVFVRHAICPMWYQTQRHGSYIMPRRRQVHSRGEHAEVNFAFKPYSSLYNI